jgi:mRNA interferase YafQ
MRTIEFANAFKKDFKLAKKQPRYAATIDELLESALQFLLNDEALPEKFYDHPLSGTWYGYRDCHLKPDLVLIYKQTDDNILRLARLGSHSHLFK